MNILGILNELKDSAIDSAIELKDSAFSFVIEKYINYNVEKYGKMSEFKVDTVTRKLSFSLNLKGETNPIDIKSNYVLEEDADGETNLIIQDTEFSREWMTSLFNDYAAKEDLKIPIPSSALKVLDL